MKHGDMVTLPGQRRRWVALNVTAKDVARGMNVDAPGLYLFTGYWYPGSGGGARSHRCYGKVVPVLPGCGRVVGQVRSAYAARRHCR